MEKMGWKGRDGNRLQGCGRHPGGGSYVHESVSGVIPAMPWAFDVLFRTIENGVVRDGNLLLAHGATECCQSWTGRDRLIGRCVTDQNCRKLVPISSSSAWIIPSSSPPCSLVLSFSTLVLLAAAPRRVNLEELVFLVTRAERGALAVAFLI